jgi:predicted nucleic acid-binding protein
LNLYVESSAVLAWLFDEPMARRVREALAGAQLVLTSYLTLVECDRVLQRAVTAGTMTEAVAADRRGLLARAAEHWIVFEIDSEVGERARRPFPAEPIRTLDAIHLATAAVVQSLVPDVVVLTLDERIRRSAREMGFRIAPAA